MASNGYHAFLQRKSQSNALAGFDPLWMPDFLFDFQRVLVDWVIRKGRAAIFADCGLGKGQPEGALILTPSGFVPNTALKPGSLVVASDGASYPLKAKYERGEQPVFRVHFSDGASFVVDADHLHIVRTNNDRQRRRPWRVVSTSELVRLPLRYGKGGKRRNYDIPLTGPVVMDGTRHWIHPYIVGVLLGDGCITKGCTLTLADQQIIDTVRALLPAGWTLARKAGTLYDYKVSLGGTNNRALVAELRRLGIYGTRSATKFIPQEYVVDSVDHRVWLLRGLMDTDGYSKDCAQFYSTSRRLATDVLSLVRSLGGAPTASVKQTSCVHKGTRRTGAPCHVVTFSLNTFNPFHLARKAARWNPIPRDNGRWIDRIEPCGKQWTICLSVASPNQSYVTEDFIVTHNTPMQLVWAENVVRQTNKRVLILTPLAVAAQTKREGEKFDIACEVSRDGLPPSAITITNYERLHYFNPADFVGVVCDESSAIKAFDGKRRKQVTRFLSSMPYRLLCTATAAPNDYVELGTASEALGELTQSEMLSMFFRSSDKQRHSLFREGDFWNREKWFFRPHAKLPFWRWVCSWARAIRSPADLGCDPGPFVLPALNVRQHVVKSLHRFPGELFPRVATTLKDQRTERRYTLEERCGRVAELVNHVAPSVVWCQYNQEGDYLEKIIPGAVQVAGRHSDEEKEERLGAFTFGQVRVLVTKPKIGAWGLNWQHCGHQTFFPSHSFEAYYQGVRRSWRFGRRDPVTVDIVTTEGEAGVTANLNKKQRKADEMFSLVVAEMDNARQVEVADQHIHDLEIPGWL